MKSNPTIAEFLATAETRVANLESLPLDSPDVGEAITAARAAEHDAYAASAATLCPCGLLPPVTPESLHDLRTFAESGPRATMGQRLADLCRLALGGRHKGLLFALRGPRAVRYIQEAADPGTADAAVARYVTALAGVLVDECPEESKAITAVLPPLRARIDAVEARHAAYRRAQLDWVASEQRAADAAVESEVRAKREGLAEFFGARATWSYVLPGSRGVVSGQAVAEICRRHGARDVHGNPVLGEFTLDELDMLRQQAEAAETIAAAAAASKQGA